MAIPPENTMTTSNATPEAAESRCKITLAVSLSVILGCWGIVGCYAIATVNGPPRPAGDTGLVIFTSIAVAFAALFAGCAYDARHPGNPAAVYPAAVGAILGLSAGLGGYFVMRRFVRINAVFGEFMVLSAGMIACIATEMVRMCLGRRRKEGAGQV